MLKIDRENEWSMIKKSLYTLNEIHMRSGVSNNLTTDQSLFLHSLLAELSFPWHFVVILLFISLIAWGNILLI